MPEDEKVDHVLRGLQIHYIDRILPLQPTSVARIREIARLVDETRDRMSQEVNVALASTDCRGTASEQNPIREMLGEVLSLIKLQQTSQQANSTYRARRPAYNAPRRDGTREGHVIC